MMEKRMEAVEIYSMRHPYAASFLHLPHVNSLPGNCI